MLHILIILVFIDVGVEKIILQSIVHKNILV